MSEICGGKEGCTSQVLFSCNCGNPIVYLCQGCVSDHLLEPRPHLFLQLDHARELQKKSTFSKSYLEVFTKYNTMKHDILAYIDSLKDFRTRICTFKQQIIQHIDTVVGSKIEHVDSLLDSSYQTLREFNKRTSDLTVLDHDILARYKNGAVRGLIEDYADVLILNEDDIKDAVENMINIDTSVPMELSNEHTPSRSSEETFPTPTFKIQGKETLSFQIQELRKDLDELRETTHSKLEEFQRDFKTLNRYTIPKVEEIQKELHHLNNKTISELQVNKKELEIFMFQINPKFEEIKRELAKLKKELDYVRPPNLTYIFAAKRGTKDLIRYDSEVDSISTYSLHHSLPHNFDLSATCVLPDGEILISGGKDSSGNFIGDTYKVDITQDPPRCIKLGDLNYPRSRACLVYHGDYVYILGGYGSNKAERMKVTEDAWSVLPDMREARWDFGTYIQGNKIYVIGGFSNTSIEFYDIHMNSFNVLENILLPKGGFVCGIIDNKLYAVGYKYLRIFSKDLELIDSQDNINNRQSLCYSNVIVKDSRLIYIDSLYSKIFSYDARSSAVAEVMGF